MLRGKGLKLRSALQLRSVAEAKEPPSPLTIPYPLRREKLLHCVQVYLALSRRKFKFDIFRVRVSVAQIYKFEQRKLGEVFLRLDKAETTEARERTNRP